MKKLLSVVAVFVLLLLLSACGGSEVEPRLCGISFTAEITYYNESYKGECTVSEDRELRFTLSEPESLSGYTLTLGAEGITAEYLGISFKPTVGSMPMSSVAEEFYEIYSSVGGTARKKGEQYEISGGSGAEAYTLYISPTGLPQSLVIPDERFSVYFYNVAIR